MKKQLLTLIGIALVAGACTKTVNNKDDRKNNPHSTAAITPKFVRYTIARGAQYCDKNTFTMVNYIQQSFLVRFDSSAIYKTVNPNNQYDINKLFGFSDNNSLHHQFSARFGWRYSDSALRLFAYVYNNGTMTFSELGKVTIGVDNSCSIRVSGDKYIFTLNGKSSPMPRASKTTTGQGYKLYPYFGGDEMAPHTISILIKEL